MIRDKKSARRAVRLALAFWRKAERSTEEFGACGAGAATPASAVSGFGSVFSTGCAGGAELSGGCITSSSCIMSSFYLFFSKGSTYLLARARVGWGKGKTKMSSRRPHALGACAEQNPFSHTFRNLFCRAHIRNRERKWFCLAAPPAGGAGAALFPWPAFGWPPAEGG